MNMFGPSRLYSRILGPYKNGAFKKVTPPSRLIPPPSLKEGPDSFVGDGGGIEGCILEAMMPGSKKRP